MVYMNRKTLKEYQPTPRQKR